MVFFFLLHPSPTLRRYHWGPRTRGGRPWTAWRLAEGNSEPGRWSLRWRRCTGVGSSWLPGSWVTVGNASRGEGEGEERDDLSLSYLPYKGMCTYYSILRNCTAVNIVDLVPTLRQRCLAIYFYFTIFSHFEHSLAKESGLCPTPRGGGRGLPGRDGRPTRVGTRRQVVRCTLPWICTAGGKIKIK